MKYKKRKTISLPKPENSVEPHINIDEIRLLLSLYDSTPTNHNIHKNEKVNFRKFYDPLI